MGSVVSQHNAGRKIHCPHCGTFMRPPNYENEGLQQHYDQYAVFRQVSYSGKCCNDTNHRKYFEDYGFSGGYFLCNQRSCSGQYHTTKVCFTCAHHNQKDKRWGTYEAEGIVLRKRRDDGIAADKRSEELRKDYQEKEKVRLRALAEQQRKQAEVDRVAAEARAKEQAVKDAAMQAKRAQENAKRAQEAKKQADQAMTKRLVNPYRAPGQSRGAVGQAASTHASMSIAYRSTPNVHQIKSDDRNLFKPSGGSVPVYGLLKPQKLFGEWAEPVAAFLNGHVFVYRYLSQQKIFEEKGDVGNYLTRWVVFNYFSVPLKIDFDPHYWSEPTYPYGARTIVTDFLDYTVGGSSHLHIPHVWDNIGKLECLDSLMFSTISGLEGLSDAETGWSNREGFWKYYCTEPANIEEYNRLKYPWKYHVALNFSLSGY